MNSVVTTKYRFDPPLTVTTNQRMHLDYDKLTYDLIDEHGYIKKKGRLVIMNEIDTSNKYMVASGQGGEAVFIMHPPIRSPLTKMEAYVLAAWLIAMAEAIPAKEDDVAFAEILEKVQS